LGEEIQVTLDHRVLGDERNRVVALCEHFSTWRVIRHSRSMGW
jgi:hypothetical protein